MLLPKRVKFRKQHRGRMTGKATSASTSVSLMFLWYSISSLAGQ